MARSPLNNCPRVSLIGSLVVCLLAPCADAAEIVRTTRTESTTALPDRLIVRLRAGLRPGLREQLVAKYAAQETRHIGALGALVIRAAPSRLRVLERLLRKSRYVKSVERDDWATAAALPNDPDFRRQWGLSKVKAPQAWSITEGSTGLTVAVVDSGIDPTHPDLVNQVVPGYDFVNDDADPTDDNGHGTRIAGIVAAQAFNSTGIAGVAPGCKLLPVKVLDANALGSYSAIASGITYAVERGARIINLSLTGPTASPLLESAIAYATARDVVVVAAAGNDAAGEPLYPAAYPDVVTVAASDERDGIAGFSNHGSWMGLSAPGVSILTTDSVTSDGFAYASVSGTSAAAAFVSGGFALVLSAHPTLSAADALAALAGTARDLGTRGWDPYSGWGRINVRAALTAGTAQPSPSPDRAVPTVSITTPARGIVSGDTAVDVVASDDVGVIRVDLLADNVTVASDTAAPFGFSWDASRVPSGKHTLRARAFDAAGNVALSNRVRVHVMH